MLLSQLIRSSRGYVLMLVLVAMAGLGGLAYYVMQSSGQFGKLDNRDMASFDRENLRTELKMVLQSGKSCDLSVKDGVFRKSKIHDPQGTGHPVKILKDGGEAASEHLKAQDQYYSLKVLSIELFLPQGEKKELPVGISTELGLLRTKVASGGRELYVDVPLSVTAQTMENGFSTFLGCRVAAERSTCEAVGMSYSEETGRCSYGDVCDGTFLVAGEGDEEDWTGERKASCSDNIGSHVRDITLTQLRTGTDIDTNGFGVNCCYPKTMMSVRCFDFEEAAELSAWSGDAQAFCDMKAGGHLSSVLISQQHLTGTSSEVNGFMFRCCYSY